MNGVGGDNVWLIYDARAQRLRAPWPGRACGRARPPSTGTRPRGLSGAIPARGRAGGADRARRWWTAGGRPTSTAARRWAPRSAGLPSWPTRPLRARGLRGLATGSASRPRGSPISSGSRRPTASAAGSGRSTIRTRCAGGPSCSGPRPDARGGARRRRGGFLPRRRSPGAWSPRPRRRAARSPHEDLAEHRAEWMEPLRIPYAEGHAASFPPPTQGSRRPRGARHDRAARDGDAARGRLRPPRWWRPPSSPSTTAIAT